jgi:hypothetical protein
VGNNMMDGIKRFEFWFGNPFCGIRKLLITFGEDLSVKSNGHNKKANPKESKIIKLLKDIDFKNWLDEYTCENPNSDNAWTITLTFDNEVIIYRGLDAYPSDWFKVLDIVEKYGGFDIESMMMDGEYDE